VRAKASERFQFVVISLKGSFYEKAQGLVGIWRDVDNGSSKTLTLDVRNFMALFLSLSRLTPRFQLEKYDDV
jgi:chromosome segregation ATPase